MMFWRESKQSKSKFERSIFSVTPIKKKKREFNNVDLINTKIKLTLSIRAKSDKIIRASSVTSLGVEESCNLLHLLGSNKPLLTS